MIAPFVAKTCEACRILMESAGVKPDGISGILLVGGTCRIPFVREQVAREFGRPVFQVDDPELAVCQGAAIFGNAKPPGRGQRKPSRPAAANARARRALTVSQDGRAGFTSISAAVRAAKNGAAIVVRPGIYHESVVIDKDITLTGEGVMQSIVLESPAGPCISLKGGVAATVGSLTLRTAAETADPSVPLISITDGRLKLDKCDLSSGVRNRLVVAAGAKASLNVIESRIHDGSGSGIVFTNGAGGEVARCDVFGFKESGVHLESDAGVSLDECRIHDGGGFGVRVVRGARSAITRCLLSNLERASVMVEGTAQPRIADCRISDGKHAGIHFRGKARGSVENCGITGHGAAGIVIADGSDPSIVGCRLLDGKDAGITVCGKASGTIDNCEISGHALSGIVTREGGSPQIRNCHIRDNGEFGILVRALGSGSADNCRLPRNAKGTHYVEAGCEGHGVLKRSAGEIRELQRYQRLTRFLESRDWTRADNESISLIRAASGHQRIDSKAKAGDIPDHVARRITELWANVGGQSVRTRPWVVNTSAASSFVSLFWWVTWIDTRLRELGLA
jgi:hypothetical protein